MSMHAYIYNYTHIVVAQIGFVKSSYTASEDDVSIMVCVEVKDGSLGIPIILSLSMNDSSSLGIII